MFDLKWPLALVALGEHVAAILLAMIYQRRNTRNTCVHRRSAFVPSDGANLHARSHQRPLFQTLSILANDMLAKIAARTIGGAEWLDTSKGIGGNCVLL
jgi:hypothetical protein